MGRRLMIDSNRLRKLSERLPGSEESTSYGTFALKVNKKLYLRLHQKEDAIVVLLNSVAEQQGLIAKDPMTYFITDHYEGYAAILVRPTIDDEEFFELMTLAWRRVARKKDLADFARQY